MRWTADQTARYEAVRFSIRARMRPERDALGRVTCAEVHRAMRAGGYTRSYRVVRAVLGGGKRSRPVLREASAAVAAILDQRIHAVPDWL